MANLIQCIGIDHKTQVRCIAHKTSANQDCKESIEDFNDTSLQQYKSEFCTIHYQRSRPFYRGYKKATELALQIFKQLNVSAYNTPVLLLLRAYGKLTMAIERRKEFMSMFVAVECRDTAHWDFIETLINAQNTCESLLLQHFNSAVSLTPPFVISATAASLTAPPPPEIEHNITDCSQPKKKKTDDFNTFLQQCVRQTQGEFKQVRQILNSIVLRLSDLAQHMAVRLRSGFLQKVNSEYSENCPIHMTDHYLQDLTQIHMITPFRFVRQRLSSLEQLWSRNHVSKSSKVLTKSFRAVLLELAICTNTSENLRTNLVNDLIPQLPDMEACIEIGTSMQNQIDCFELSFLPAMIKLIEHSNIRLDEAIWLRDWICSAAATKIYPAVDNTAVDEMFVLHQFSVAMLQLSIPSFLTLVPPETADQLIWVALSARKFAVPVHKAKLSTFLQYNKQQMFQYRDKITLYLKSPKKHYQMAMKLLSN